MNLYSYIVRYDSGFAPNPFYGYCTLATCKPKIRNEASAGDLIIGCGSADRKRKQKGRLVYAMKVSEILTFAAYFKDKRFFCKKPNLRGSKKQARGDNIYSKENNGAWKQLDSCHSKQDGSPDTDHITRDTQYDKVLISSDYVYFGRDSRCIPERLNSGRRSLCHRGRGYSKFSTTDGGARIKEFIKWLCSLECSGFVGNPCDWE